MQKRLLLVLALLLAGVEITYGILWMIAIRRPQTAYLGIEREWEAGPPPALRVTRVHRGSSAERAGLHSGDRIAGVNDSPVSSMTAFDELVATAAPRSILILRVILPGDPEPQAVTAILDPSPFQATTTAQAIAMQMNRSFPALFVIVGLAVLFLRVEDRNAWLLALMFASIIAVAPMLGLEWAIPKSWRRFSVFYYFLFSGIMPALFYRFFAIFPVRSPIDRRLPWLKHVLLGGAVPISLPLAVWGFVAGDSLPLLHFKNWIAPFASPALLFAIYFNGTFTLAIASLLGNLRGAPSLDACRKIRVILFGTVATAPYIILAVFATRAGQEVITYYPFWFFTPAVLATFLMPLSFAYAVVKHRVLEIPVLLKRSARYVLVQRGFFVLMLVDGIVAVAVFVWLFTRWTERSNGTGAALPAGLMAGVGFGLLLAWGWTNAERKISARIDRAFFRSAYDARQILLDLAEKARVAASRQELTASLSEQIRQALQPESLTVCLETAGSIPKVESGFGDQTAIECEVPLVGREGRLIGRIILGPRRSEEPYSGEDLRLLASVAAQAAVTLENIRLAEEIARRIETDARTGRDIEIAKSVQARLFPQRVPAIQTLEYIGGCIQARGVGGDYFDYLDMGAGRVGLVLADIVGKGIASSLLMANLQANLRSQYVLALDDPARLMKSVNRLFFESTLPHQYATLFFGSYDDATRSLRYVNCGHNPPILVRSSGAVESLSSTATVVGLFEEWECEAREVALVAGDILVVYSDGVSEAFNDAGEEFGEHRLLEEVCRRSDRSVANLLKAITDRVMEFSGVVQEDDVTLLVARAR